MKKFFVHIMNFIRNGFKVFTLSSKGKYNVRSSSVNDLRKEIFDSKKSSFITDRNKLKSDQKNIGIDVRNSMKKLLVE